MAQHDYLIADQSGLSFLSDLNQLAAAIVSNNSGGVEPTDLYAYMWWVDTTSGIVKQRNAANTAWINKFLVTDDLTTALKTADIGVTVQAFDSDILFRSAPTGSAILPSGTTGQRDGSPSAGYFRYNSTLLAFEGYNGSAWGAVGGGATGGGADEIFLENGQTVTADYTIPVGRNAMSTGDITINTGITVTVSTGSNWVVI